MPICRCHSRPVNGQMVNMAVSQSESCGSDSPNGRTTFPFGNLQLDPRPGNDVLCRFIKEGIKKTQDKKTNINSNMPEQ